MLAYVVSAAPSPLSWLLPQVEQNGKLDWAKVAHFLVGNPLRIVAIVVLALVLRVLVHRSIRGIENRAARPVDEELFGSKRAAQVVLRAGTANTARRAARARTLGSLMRSISTAVIYTMAGVMILDLVGLPIGPLLASAGIAGVALGFGAQNLVKDFISGVFMLAEDQYGVGDVIDTGQATGTVEGVGLRVTRLRDADGVVWFVRNGEVLRIGNKSQGWSRALVDVAVARDEEPDRVRLLLADLAAELALDPAYRDKIVDQPEVWGVESVTPDSIVLRVMIKTIPLEQGPVAREFRERVQEMFERERVRVPPPRSALFGQPPPA